ncbi:major facilitator superfamily domain-containing protein [Collybia nuda]|uniref:Major facilitator superfamily domain-containing protein n=1 Tax=Collybia nuda TaxID=64659 RepID=A0A9P6CGQ1_9AGAR|nr:major facilitator superfamily domain-containing protein [Collybia nuda]
MLSPPSASRSPSSTTANSLSNGSVLSNIKSKESIPGEERIRRHKKDFGLLPIPQRLRYDPNKILHFGLFMKIAFGFASTFTIANLYYCQPLLVQQAETFHVTFSQVSKIPTLVQAGYAAGVFFISPLGDLVRRRPLILALITISGSLTIVLATTNNVTAFEAVTFIVGAASATPMVLLPLAADLAPVERRASAISIVLSGLFFGILVARVIAGVIAQFTSWRVVYYFAIGVQLFVLVGCYLIVPDYPPKNKNLTYWDILRSMGKYAVTEPLLIQAMLVNIATSACFANFWVTLTFLLAGPPYHYSTLVIGLFGLVGMLGVALGPIVGRLVDKLVPWHASLISVVLLGCIQAIQVGAGGINISAVIIVAFALDVFRQMLQVSLTTSVFSLAPEARSRLNALLILTLFMGQVLGTSVGTEVFVKYGWRASAWLSLGWYGWQVIILLLRGPHCKRYTWFGYEGGLEGRKAVIEKREEFHNGLEKAPPGIREEGRTARES